MWRRPMDTKLLNNRIRKLESEVVALRTRLSQCDQGRASEERGLCALKGIWSGLNLSFEEIREAALH